MTGIQHIAALQISPGTGNAPIETDSTTLCANLNVEKLGGYTLADILALITGRVPAGCIMLWSGTVVSIPAGWVLCDGSNGTPDLRERFVMGAGTSAPGSTGGAATHTHSVTSNVSVADHSSHTHTYTEVPNHTHLMTNLLCRSSGTGSDSTIVNALPDPTAALAGPYATDNPTGGVATGTTNGPSATLSHAVTNNAVTSGAGSSLPPYYALAYIMKT